MSGNTGTYIKATSLHKEGRRRILWYIFLSHQKQARSRGEREFPFPIIPGNTGLPFPFPKFGNEFFIPVPVPKNWECYFPFPFPFPQFGNAIFCSRSR